jgi:hypothetical protein
LAEDFIKLVIENMRYRRPVQQEVMNELAAHFEDELKDCKDEQEREQRAKQVIENFGDPKLLGILLRRAKKRCRPLWRTIVVRSFQTAGVLIACLIVYVVWFAMGKPVITTDYVAELNRIVRPAADESQNAAPLYENAIRLIKENSDYNDLKELVGKKYDEVTAADKEKMQKWITKNKEVFDLVSAGSARPYYWRIYQTDSQDFGMMGIMLPELAKFRSLAKLLVWRAQLSAQQGRYEDSFNDLTVCYRFGRHIRRGNVILVEQLVGIAVEALSVGTIRDILSSHQVDSNTLKALQENLERAFADENFVINFAAERLCMYDRIQACFTDSAFGSHLYLPRIGSLSLGSVKEQEYFWPAGFFTPFVHPKMTFHILFTHPGKKETRQMADGLYDYYEKIARKSPAQLKAENEDSEQYFLRKLKDNLFLGIMAPAFGRIIQISYRFKTEVPATVAIIALQRYKQDKGQYPESLDELRTAGFIKAVPIDPWSDKSLVYKKTDAGFTLYSVGMNFKDDGGKMGIDNDGKPRSWSENGDAVFWPVIK